MKLVASLDDLLALPRDRRVNGFGARARVQLELVGMPRSRQLHAQQRLNRFQSRCGCVAGGVALLLTLALGAGYLISDAAGPLSWQLVPSAAGVVIAAFFVGLAAKLVTLGATRWQFAHECRVQHRALARLPEGSNGL